MPNYYYNGVELPALPEWDKETYPYAIIGSLNNGYWLVITEEQHQAYDTYMSLYTTVMLKSSLDGNTWGELTDPSLDVMFAYYDKLLWSNYDIVTDSGVLKLAASDPVPVPEEPEQPSDNVIYAAFGIKHNGKWYVG